MVAHLGSIMQVAISFNGMVGGVTLGLFSLGMFFPWANGKVFFERRSEEFKLKQTLFFQGAIFGSIVAVALITVMCIGQQISIANGFLTEPNKPISVEKCSFNETTDFDLLNTR